MKHKIGLFIMMAFLICSLSADALEFHYIEDAVFDDRVTGYTFTRGLAKVWRQGESAVVNNYGNIVIDYSPVPKEVTPNGLIALLGENGKIGFFNREGTQITDYIYDSFTDTNEKTGDITVGYLSTMYMRSGDGTSDLIPVSKDGKFGYVNPYGTVVISFKYEYAYGFSGGIARVCSQGKLSDYGTYTEGKYGFIREDGTEILPPDSYWIAHDFDTSLGYAVASNGEADTVLVDRHGKVSKFNPGGYTDIDVSYIVVNPQEGYYGVTDIYGNYIVPVEKSEPIFSGNYRFVVADTIRNYYNEVLYTAPENGSIFTELGKNNFLCIAVSSDGMFGSRTYGMTDWNGNVILEPVYKSVSDIGDGLIRAETDSGYLVFDYNGRLLCETEDKPFAAYDGFLVVSDADTLTSKIAVNPLKRPQVYLDGVKVKFTDAYPYFEGQRTMIPLRSVFEEAGAMVEWNQETSVVTVTKDDLTVSMKIGDKNIKIGDDIYETDVAPVALNNRTYIPLRVFSEGIGMNVVWDGENYTVNLESKLIKE